MIRKYCAFIPGWLIEMLLFFKKIVIILEMDVMLVENSLDFSLCMTNLLLYMNIDNLVKIGK